MIGELACVVWLGYDPLMYPPNRDGTLIGQERQGS